MVINDVLSEPRLNEIFQENNGNLVKNNKLVNSVITNNFCFVISSTNTYQILPDRMLDYFTIQNIVDCTTLHQEEELTRTLKKIINNTSRFRNLISLLQEATNMSEYDFYTEIESSILQEINGMKVIYLLKLNWSNSRIQISEGKIISLNLSSCKIKILLENFKEFFELQRLNLDNNLLPSLPESIGSLKKLRELSLCDNQLSSLPESIGSLQNLQDLYLYDNQLSSLPESIGSLKKLRELSLCDNQLSSLPESIGSLKKLRELYLWNNQLSSLPESITSLKKLRELHLWKNQLSSLPESIGSLKKLRELDLENNQLSSLPESIGSLHNLRELRLDRKLLSSLSKSMKATMKKLRKN